MKRERDEQPRGRPSGRPRGILPTRSEVYLLTHLAQQAKQITASMSTGGRRECTATDPRGRIRSSPPTGGRRPNTSP